MALITGNFGYPKFYYAFRQAQNSICGMWSFSKHFLFILLVSQSFFSYVCNFNLPVISVTLIV
jgi:hypothetical protein